MTSKKPDDIEAKEFKWINVGKGVGLVILSLIGGTLGTTGMMTAGVIGGASTDSPAQVDTQNKLEIHTATDSVRWVYMEQRISRIETLAIRQLELQERILYEIRK